MVNSRAKGGRGEREACGEVETIFGIPCRRSQQYAGSTGSADIVRDDEAGTPIWPGVHPEVKRVEKLSIYDAIEQATRDGGGAIPVVFHKRNRGEWLAIVPLARLKELSRIIHANQDQTV